MASGAPQPAGELVFEGKGPVRRSFFRYATSWLRNPDAPPLVPALLPKRNKAVRSDPFEVPLPFHDAGPDGWGKSILAAAFPNTTFGMGEFLAAAGDERTGDLGFGPTPEEGPQRFEPEEPFLDLPGADETLEELMEAAESVEEGRAERHHLRLLFRSSADVGGARPKARVQRDGRGCIAKFPARGDPFDDPKAEAVCLSLAGACGIEVPGHETVRIAGRTVLLVERFDRAPDGRRFGYMSAGTLLGHPPDAYHTRHSYADVAVRAREIGARPCEADLYRRLLFNAFIHNTDDHLRNHAFLRDGAEWRLSPAFDLVPHRQARLVLRPARDVDPHPDPAIAAPAYPAFDLSRAEASAVYGEIVAGLTLLPDLLDRYEVSRGDRALLLDLMRHAAAPPPFPG
nr:type II toxin-antitoxin system HipA family toxin [Azospirillum sp. SYSU D00513]